MGDSNKVLESGTGKTEEHSKGTDSVGLIDLTQESIKNKLFR